MYLVMIDADCFLPLGGCFNGHLLLLLQQLTNLHGASYDRIE